MLDKNALTHHINIWTSVTLPHHLPAVYNAQPPTILFSIVALFKKERNPLLQVINPAIKPPLPSSNLPYQLPPPFPHPLLVPKPISTISPLPNIHISCTYSPSNSYQNRSPRTIIHITSCEKKNTVSPS